jgi:hypothetical protein
MQDLGSTLRLLSTLCTGDAITALALMHVEVPTGGGDLAGFIGADLLSVAWGAAGVLANLPASGKASEIIGNLRLLRLELNLMCFGLN